MLCLAFHTYQSQAGTAEKARACFRNGYKADFHEGMERLRAAYRAKSSYPYCEHSEPSDCGTFRFRLPAAQSTAFKAVPNADFIRKQREYKVSQRKSREWEKMNKPADASPNCGCESEHPKEIKNASWSGIVFRGVLFPKIDLQFGVASAG